MRGISFRIKNEYSNSLSKIFLGIDLEKYFWNISEDEIYYDSNVPLFEDKNITGIDYYKKIGENYYLVSANIKAFLEQEENVHITNYDDYIKSNCQIIVLICDSVFIEIYCKDSSYIKIIKRNAIVNGYTEIEYITDDNDSRTAFSIA